MPAGQRYPSRETADAIRWRSTADELSTLDVAPPLAAALAHVLRASAGELEVGRSLPKEIRLAANHLATVVGHVRAGTGTEAPSDGWSQW